MIRFETMNKEEMINYLENLNFYEKYDKEEGLNEVIDWDDLPIKRIVCLLKKEEVEQ